MKLSFCQLPGNRLHSDKQPSIITQVHLLHGAIGNKECMRLLMSCLQLVVLSLQIDELPLGLQDLQENPADRPELTEGIWR